MASSQSAGCLDDDECATGNNRCPDDSTCTNNDGGYTCDCPAGYQWDSAGGVCADVNECSDPNVCSQHSSCANDDGSYLCVCDVGYSKGSSDICEDVNECDEVADEICESFGAVCINIPGGYTCQCPEGRYLDGFLCVEDATDCGANNPCGENSICSLEGGDYTCQCDDGYFGTGQLCFDKTTACRAGIVSQSVNCTTSGTVRLSSSKPSPLILFVILLLTLFLFH